MICQEEPENAIHCIFSCRYAREVWKNSPLAMEVEQWPAVEGKDAVLLSLHTIEKSMHGLFVALCWSIWLARNDKVWNQKVP